MSARAREGALGVPPAVPLAHAPWWCVCVCVWPGRQVGNTEQKVGCAATPPCLHTHLHTHTHTHSPSVFSCHPLPSIPPHACTHGGRRRMRTCKDPRHACMARLWCPSASRRATHVALARHHGLAAILPFSGHEIRVAVGFGGTAERHRGVSAHASKHTCTASTRPLAAPWQAGHARGAAALRGPDAHSVGTFRGLCLQRRTH